jgi:hypothetical protein
LSDFESASGDHYRLFPVRARVSSSRDVESSIGARRRHPSDPERPYRARLDSGLHIDESARPLSMIASILSLSSGRLPETGR